MTRPITCEYAGDDCLLPAGFGTAGGYYETTTGSLRGMKCYICWRPVCANCSAIARYETYSKMKGDRFGYVRRRVRACFECKTPPIPLPPGEGPLTVYRVETPDRKGAYNSGLFWTVLRTVTPRANASGSRHPNPSNDGIDRVERSYERFGFVSFKALSDWFGEYSTALEEQGELQIVAMQVARKDIRSGKKQVVYRDRGQARTVIPWSQLADFYARENPSWDSQHGRLAMRNRAARYDTTVFSPAKTQIETGLTQVGGWMSSPPSGRVDDQLDSLKYSFASLATAQDTRLSFTIAQ